MLPYFIDNIKAYLKKHALTIQFDSDADLKETIKMLVGKKGLLYVKTREEFEEQMLKIRDKVANWPAAQKRYVITALDRIESGVFVPCQETDIEPGWTTNASESYNNVS